MRTTVKQSLIDQETINHVCFVLDRSGTMAEHTESVIATMDQQVKILAKKSRAKNQETRVTVVMFDYEIDVLVYDKDVLRLPSISHVYKTRRGRTALLDATMQAIDDLSSIPHLYGDHANLVISVTDGLDNESSITPSRLRSKIASLGEKWTMVTFVPDAYAEDQALNCGFPAGNIRMWNADTKGGYEEAAKDMAAATERWMDNRARGITSSKNMFSTGADAVNTRTVREAGLKPLTQNRYERVFAHQDFRMDDLVREKSRYDYKRLTGFYPLHKRELIQGNKKLALWDKDAKQLYYGPGVRAMVGLSEGRDERVTPQPNDRFEIYVQSGADNRKIPERKYAVVIPEAV